MRICNTRTYGSILAAGTICLLLLLFAWALPFGLRVLPGGATRVEHVREAIATIDGRQELVTLPHTFRGLEPGTDIRLTFQVYEAEPFSMLVKGVYSPFTVTCKGARLSTYGEPGTYPAFLTDPPTSLQVVNLPAVPYTDKLRTITVTYKMPQTRASLPVVPFAVSNMAGVFRGEFRWLILGFLLECTLVLVGILLLLLAGLSHHVAHSQKMLLYLGLFFLAVGLWNVGENDFSIFVFRNPTFLYLLTFSGLFFIVAPLYGFALQAVTFRWHRLLTAVMYVSFTAATLALLLQFTGRYMLSQSLYVFHVLHCASLVLLTVALAFEAIHERNTHARWMLIPIACLLTTAPLELANYHLFHWFDFSLGFLSGTILFLLLLLVLTAAIIRRNARIQEAYIAQQHQTELMGVRLDAEKTRHDMILQEEQRLARLRHDMKHHVALVAELAARGAGRRVRQSAGKCPGVVPPRTIRHGDVHPDQSARPERPSRHRAGQHDNRATTPQGRSISLQQARRSTARSRPAFHRRPRGCTRWPRRIHLRHRSVPLLRHFGTIMGNEPIEKEPGRQMIPAGLSFYVFVLS